MEGEERQALIWERVVRRQYTVNGRCHGCAARNTDGPPVCHSAIRHSTISIFNTLSTRYRLIIWQYRPIINYPPLYFITAERRREILLWPASDRPDSVVGLYGTQLQLSRWVKWGRHAIVAARNCHQLTCALCSWVFHKVTRVPRGVNSNNVNIKYMRNKLVFDECCSRNRCTLTVHKFEPMKYRNKPIKRIHTDKWYNIEWKW